MTSDPSPLVWPNNCSAAPALTEILKPFPASSSWSGMSPLWRRRCRASVFPSSCVREHVASGLYGSASEVIREALRLFEAYQSVQRTRLAALKADIDQGLADIEAGRVSPVNMADIKAESRRLRKSS